MRTIIDLPNSLYQRATSIINSGRYRSLNEIIVAAIETQLVLEESDAGPVIMASDSGLNLISKAKNTEPLAMSKGSKEVKGSISQMALKGSSEQGSLPAEVKRIYKLDIPTAPMPDLSAVNNRPYWMWGINHIVPVKAAIRIAASLATEGGGKIGLKRLHEAGGNIALHIGDYLDVYDDKMERKHGNRLSSGFPRSGEDDHKTNASAERFAWLQFGSIRKKTGRIDGALYELRLVSIEASDDGGVVMITDPGYEFARLHSPILDNDQGDIQTALSLEEADWYIQHIKERVPREYEDLSRAIKYIQGGHGDAKEFLISMKQDYPDLSDKARASLRVCILGRLLDLQIIARDANSKYILKRDME